MLNALKALVAGVLANEPALVVGVLVSVGVAGAALLPFTVPLTAITAVAVVIVGALVTRLKVTPVK